MASESNSFYGVYRGVVFDNRDPEKHGRLRLTIPQILGSTATEWAWGRDTPSAKFNVPAIGQGVWVMFEGGNPHFPMWIGTFGKQMSTSKPLIVNPWTASLTGISSLVIASSSSDATLGIDLSATLLAMANKITELEERVAVLEGQMPTALAS